MDLNRNPLTLKLAPGFGQAWQTFLREVLGKPEESGKLVVPAAIYAFQNNILYQECNSIRKNLT